MKRIKETYNLESMLRVFFNRGKAQKLLLKKVRKDDEGRVVECFTGAGAKAYVKFTDFCTKLSDSGFATPAHLKSFMKSLANLGIGDGTEWHEIIDTTDMIAAGWE